MTLLQISEKIRDHLIKQKARSVQGGTCAYRCEADGLMCAVGCLITDSAYNTNFEQRGSSYHAVQEALSKSLKLELDVDSRDVMKFWQNYHDTWHCDGMLIFNYGEWIRKDNCDPESPNSPQAFLDYLKGLKRYDMSGEITKRYLAQVSKYVRAHLLKQGKQAVNEEGNCQYRTEDGCMCAVGVMIDNEHYDANFEGGGLTGDVRIAVAASLGVEDFSYNTPMYDVLRGWQLYHDNSTSTFSAEEINEVHKRLMSKLEDAHKYPNLKD